MHLFFSAQNFKIGYITRVIWSHSWSVSEINANSQRWPCIYMPLSMCVDCCSGPGIWIRNVRLKLMHWILDPPASGNVWDLWEMKFWCRKWITGGGPCSFRVLHYFLFTLDKTSDAVEQLPHNPAATLSYHDGVYLLELWNALDARLLSCFLWGILSQQGEK